MTAKALAELTAVVDRIEPAHCEALITATAGARRIAVYGVGREGLMMRALTMRLLLDHRPPAPVPAWTTAPSPPTDR